MGTQFPLLVTGGNQGIGEATVRLAVSRGYHVLFTYRRNVDAANRIVADFDRSVRAVRCDLGREGDIQSLYKLIDDDFGGVCGVVNNAATQASSNSLLADADMADIAELIKVNVTGTISVTREAVRRMAKSRGGSGGAIVMVSSVAARLGAANAQIWYAASKGALDSLTTGLAREVATDGIRVNAVSPGPTDTNDRPEQLQRMEMLKATIPMGRLGQPGEIAAAILWLLSDEASFVTGANLTVSGGR
ncbi:SDR family oxidoreductase [Mesorhizobium sp. 10J20-29]